jgi:hypothetical protein
MAGLMAGLMATTCSRTPLLSRSATLPSSPDASSWTRVGAMIGARYLSHGSPISVHISINTLSESRRSVLAAYVPLPGPARVFASAVCRNHPPAVGTRPCRDTDEFVEQRPLSSLAADAYWWARFLGISLRLPSRTVDIPEVHSGCPKPGLHFASTLGASRRRLDGGCVTCHTGTC